MSLRAYFVTCVCGLAALCPLVHGNASVPQARIPASVQNVKIDGVLSADEWSDAAILRRFGPNLSSPADPPVMAYIKHDADAILVAFRCTERDPRYPRAVMCSTTGNLNLDDAVQVVMGLADSNVVQRDVLNMGGYEGAMGTQAVSADHYYQFTINSAGAMARTYNEVPLENPRFTAAVSQDSAGWSAEMRIPLASFGAAASEGQTIFFNAFRFRPPEMVAWYLPGFGGYYPMPLGKITLLPTSRAHERSVEAALPALMKPSLKNFLPLSCSIGYYPLSGRIVGTVAHTESAKADRAILRVSGLPDATLALKSGDQQNVVVEIPKGSQPHRTAELQIYQGQKLIRKIERDLHAVTAPEWVGTKAGEAYVQEKIPAPWRQPEIQGRSIALVDKKIRFGAYAMPESVAGQSELLAGPVEIVARRGERDLNFVPTQDTSLRNDGNSVIIEASAADGAVGIQTRTQLDYDGFMVVKMKLSGIVGEQLSRLAVRIPLKKEVGKYYHRTLVQEAAALDGFGFECPAGPLWCGSEELGLSFNYDKDPFVSTDRRRQVRLIEEADKVWMELNFVDGAGQYSGGDRIFRFFLQPTPTKPMDLAKIHSRINWWWEGWSDYQGYPDLAKMPALRQWADDLHAQGRLGLLYTCQGLAENSPGFKEFAEDLMMDSKWNFYQRAFNPGKGVPCYATCKQGPEGELQLWSFEKLVKEARIDGTVSDGLSIAWGCRNPGHDHGYDPQISWDGDEDTNVVAQRKFLKRLRGIFNESGRPFFMAAHTGGGLDINTLSFFDGYMEGEQLARYPRDYQIPPAKYAVGYSGRPWGLRTVFWEKTWRRQKGFFWSLTYALLHDNELEDSPIVREILDGFDNRPGTEYHPYWRTESRVGMRSAAGVCKVSYYQRKDAALVIAGNMSMVNDHVELNLAELFPGRPLCAVDLISGQTLELNNNKWSGELPAGQCVAISVQTKVAAADVGETLVITPESWKLSGRQNGVSLSEILGPDGTKALRLCSTQWADEACLELKTLPTTDASVSLLVRHTGRLRIRVGDGCVVYDSGWRGEGFSSGNDSLLQPTPVHDQFVPVEISIRGQRFDITYGGKPLGRGLIVPVSKSRNMVISTWAGDSVEVIGRRVSSAAKDLYLPGIGAPRVGTVNLSPPAIFTKPNLTDRSVWQTNQGAEGVTVAPTLLNGREAWKMSSVAYKAAPRAVLQGVALRDSGTVVMSIRASDRFNVAFGDIVIQHDGVWSVGGPLNGWSQGQIYQIPLDPKKEYLLTLSVHRGLLNASFGDRILVRDMHFDMASQNNQIRVETWGGDSVEFCALDMTEEARTVFVPQGIRHPVR